MKLTCAVSGTVREYVPTAPPSDRPGEHFYLRVVASDVVYIGAVIATRATGRPAHCIRVRIGTPMWIYAHDTDQQQFVTPTAPDKA